MIKIEQCGKGDPIRHRTHYGRASFDLPCNRNLFFEAANRNKKSVTIDMSRQEGKEIVYRLIPQFDIFLTNLRRKTVEKMAMTYPILSRLNPRLIYVSVSAYGPKGPDKDLGGFDFQGQARSGIMYSMGEPEMPPFVMHFGLVDQVTAIVVSQAMLAGLFMRERTGRGQEIQTSILGAALNLAYCNFLNALWLNQDVTRHNRIDTDPARNYYCCRDGKWVSITLQPNADLARFYQAIGHPELEKDARFDTEEKRTEGYSGELISLLEQTFLTRARDEWLEAFREYDLPACPVNWATELKDDPQVRANYLDEINHPSLGKVAIPSFPVNFNQARAGTRKVAPELGENTEEILREFGGYNEQEIERFQKEEII